MLLGIESFMTQSIKKPGNFFFNISTVCNCINVKRSENPKKKSTSSLLKKNIEKKKRGFFENKREKINFSLPPG